LRDGRHVELRLLEVDVDGNQLLGRTSYGTPMRIPLLEIQSVWQRRRLLGRCFSVFFGVIAASALVGVLLAGHASVRVTMGGAVEGAFVGALVGFGLLGIFDEWAALYEWTLLYERAAA
jgi:hypothetical protein